MKKIIFTIFAVLVLLIAYFILWPVPIKPVSWDAPPPPEYAGPHEVNTRLADLQIISLGDEEDRKSVV